MVLYYSIMINEITHFNIDNSIQIWLMHGEVFAKYVNLFNRNVHETDILHLSNY